METKTQDVEFHQVDVVAEASDQMPATEPDPQLPQSSQSASTLMAVIEKVASMPQLDDGAMDRIERLFEMNERMVDRQAETVYNEAMARAQSAMQSVVTNKYNDHTKSGFANLEAVHTACKPMWTQHGFSVSTSMNPSTIQNHVLVVTEVRHSGGFKQVYQNDWPLDGAGVKGATNKTPIQAMGSTSQYARRYTELMIFDIAIKHEDNDGNGSGAKVKPAEQCLTNAQIKNLRNAMEMAGVNDDEVCKKAQISRIEDLQQGRLQGMINLLKSYSNKQEQQ